MFISFFWDINIAGEAPTVWIDVYHVINKLYRNIFIDRLALDKKQLVAVISELHELYV